MVEKRVGASVAQLSWWQRQPPLGKEREPAQDSDVQGSEAPGSEAQGSEAQKRKKKSSRLSEAKKREGKPTALRAGKYWGREKRSRSRRKKKPQSAVAVASVRAYREGRTPHRETKAQKKGGSLRQIPRGVSTKRGKYRACKWLREGLTQGQAVQAQGSVKALRVERGVNIPGVSQEQSRPRPGKGQGKQRVAGTATKKSQGKPGKA